MEHTGCLAASSSSQWAHTHEGQTGWWLFAEEVSAARLPRGMQPAWYLFSHWYYG